ncbi:MAG: transporter substrate-binding domain-containing protein [Alphaproteobacteria bacterium]|nr:transporter substrate-binding domain-containing protein [Alphaproteobacteria bacterium]
MSARTSPPCMWLAALGLSLIWFLPDAGFAQTPNGKAIVPDAWQGDVQRPRPDMQGVERLRFVTDNDYPPFHYIDEVGALTGFNVDLAKAICEALEVQCEVRDIDWSELLPSLDRDEADAAIASIRITAEALEKADFTTRYYATPARFVARKDTELTDIRPETVEDVKIGVVKGTGHEAYLTKFFPDAEIVSLETVEDTQKALQGATVDFIFGDGIGLTFWINGVSSEGCCEFRGGPYIDTKHFGEGVGIAVKRGNRRIGEILNYGLEQVHASGRYEELFLRYFPMSFF